MALAVWRGIDWILLSRIEEAELPTSWGLLSAVSCHGLAISCQLSAKPRSLALLGTTNPFRGNKFSPDITTNPSPHANRYHTVERAGRLNLQWFWLKADSSELTALLRKLRRPARQPLDALGDWGMGGEQAAEVHSQERLDDE